ncbi:MAG: hypothetical protein HY322_14330 [Betaproteobacteria bacterium]|nr:hypothetical protein [Betaproteobacteria bacterium]
MSYLDRLKAEISEKAIPEQLPKLPKAPYGSFDSAPSRHISETEAANDSPDVLPDPGAEARRQRVLAMLAEHPGVRYAAITDALAVPGSVMLTLAIRHVVTVELLIPAAKWDGVLFLHLLERHGATVH